MKLITAINRIRAGAHDISSEYSRDDLINFLNTVTQQAAAMMVAGGYHELIREITLHNGDFAPKNMLKTCGNYPIKITSGQVEFLDPDETSVQYRYFATPDNIPVDATDDYELFFTNDAVNEAIVRQATILALNQNEYNVQQDSSLYAAFQQAITAAMTE